MKKKSWRWGLKFFNALLTGLLILSVILQLKIDVPFSNFQLKTVLTGSMSPAIQAGDLILVKEVPTESLEIGDIISFTQVNETVTHRIVAIEHGEGGDIFWTQGDANNFHDGGVSENQFHGKVFAHIPKIGEVVLTIASPLGKKAMLLTLLTIFMLKEFILLVIKEKNKEKRGEKESVKYFV